MHCAAVHPAHELFWQESPGEGRRCTALPLVAMGSAASKEEAAPPPKKGPPTEDSQLIRK